MGHPREPIVARGGGILTRVAGGRAPHDLSATTPRLEVASVSLRIPCPRCGLRPYTEFTFGGELRDWPAEGGEEEFRRVYLRRNLPGPQVERWFHALGCRRWLTVTRDTATNRIG